MLSLRQQSGILHVDMRDIVDAAEARDARTVGHRCLCGGFVKAVVVDIRGCKPIDSDTIDELKGLYDEARDRGVERFVRIGDGTLCAVQFTALERACNVTDRTQVCHDDDAAQTLVKV